MIYLATPYSHDDPKVREQRFQWAAEATSILMRRGYFILSPIAHTHPIVQYGLPKGWRFWKAYDTELIQMCVELWVLAMPGWEKSVGIRAEIQLAHALKKRVRYVTFLLDGRGKLFVRLK